VGTPGILPDISCLFSTEHSVAGRGQASTFFIRLKSLSRGVPTSCGFVQYFRTAHTVLVSGAEA
jgi:hypothetical protein